MAKSAGGGGRAGRVSAGTKRYVTPRDRLQRAWLASERLKSKMVQSGGGWTSSRANLNLAVRNSRVARYAAAVQRTTKKVGIQAPVNKKTLSAMVSKDMRKQVAAMKAELAR